MSSMSSWVIMSSEVLGWETVKCMGRWSEMSTVDLTWKSHTSRFVNMWSRFDSHAMFFHPGGVRNDRVVYVGATVGALALCLPKSFAASG